tara:strand:+ start:309 stop:800 length:492 start_codon:yes stop_codon:yes gene_type:complete
MPRYRKRRITWRDRPLFNSRVPFDDGFSVGCHNNRMSQINREPYTSKQHLPKDQTRMTKKPYDRPKNKIWSNENVAAAGTLGVGAAAMARTAVGIAVDKMNTSVTSAIEEGFAQHAAFNDSGIPTFDALTESAMAGKWLSRIEAGAARMVPLVEELLDVAILV